MGEPLVQPAPVYMHPGVRPEDNIKCCFCIDGLTGMYYLAVLTCITPISYWTISIIMFAFVLKDTRDTRRYLLWALRLSFIRDYVIILYAVFGIIPNRLERCSGPGFSRIYCFTGCFCPYYNSLHDGCQKTSDVCSKDRPS